MTHRYLHPYHHISISDNKSIYPIHPTIHTSNYPFIHPSIYPSMYRIKQQSHLSCNFLQTATTQHIHPSIHVYNVYTHLSPIMTASGSSPGHIGGRMWHLKEYPGSMCSIALAVALVMTMLNMVMMDRVGYGVIDELLLG